MLFGIGLAFYLGKPLIEPTAPRLPSIDFGWWSDIPQVRAALRINVLFLIGVALAPILVWALADHALGPDRPHGRRERRRRARHGLFGQSSSACAPPCSAASSPASAARSCRCTIPGSWNEGLSSGQGITAVALVIFARWNPMLCLWASLLFGGAAALGPALQSVGVTARLSSVQRRALYPDAADHDRDLLAEAHADRRAGGAVDHEVTSCPDWRASRAAGGTLRRRRSLSVAV